MNYPFETDHFGLTDDKLHLLRSRYNYKTYDASDISEVEIAYGRLINNWLAVLILGIGLLLCSMYYGAALIQLLLDGKGTKIYIEEVAVPVLPFFIGAYSVYMSLRTGPTLKVTFEQTGKAKSFPLDKTAKHHELDTLTSLLRSSASWKSKSVIRV